MGKGWFLLQALCGPAILAYMPDLWRASTILAIFKKGSPRYHESFRMVFVKVQLGLLLEAILAARLRSVIFWSLRPCDSGYCKGVEDSHLVLHEIVSLAPVHKRSVWAVLGDFLKAFPRTWRELLLTLAGEGPRIHGGAFALLSSILKLDLVSVWLSGSSTTCICQGMPEGGSIGPLAYNLLPDSL